MEVTCHFVTYYQYRNCRRFGILEPIKCAAEIRHLAIIVRINPLNPELNPVCHLLILLGDLTFMVPCIVSISNKMQRYTVCLYLETALHVSGGTCTHHQERIQLYLQRLVFVLWVAYATHSTLKPFPTLPR
jgi:hypothetical protein